MLGKMMRRWIKFVGLGLSLAVSGCAEDMADGGQTGSLLPCELESDARVFIPAGVAAYAQPSAAGLTSAKITDASGREVSSSLSRRGETAVIVTGEPLSPGEYTIATQCNSRTVLREITVTEAAPLPTSFGEITSVNVEPRRPCSELRNHQFLWQPTDAFVPYLSLTELTVVLDGESVGVLPLIAPLQADSTGRVPFAVPVCGSSAAFCVPPQRRFLLHRHVARGDGSLVLE